jgi:hypothetical protein
VWSAEPDPTTATPPGSVPILDIDALLEEVEQEEEDRDLLNELANS